MTKRHDDQPEPAPKAPEMPGNPHAELMESYADPRNSLEASATLALAYEQRTANLIAYLNTGYNSFAYHPGENVLKAVQARIEERLGLA